MHSFGMQNKKKCSKNLPSALIPVIIAMGVTNNSTNNRDGCYLTTNDILVK